MNDTRGSNFPATLENHEGGQRCGQRAPEGAVGLREAREALDKFRPVEWKDMYLAKGI